MRRTPILLALIPLALLAPALTACGGGDSADTKVTETRMDDIDSVEGTISDEMIPSDENAELAPVEATPAPVAKAKASDKADAPAAKAEPKAAEPAEAESQ